MSHKFPDSLIQDYHAITNGENYYDIMRNMAPHSFAISAYAHKQLMDTKMRQAIVISGESGAGKTESARQCMTFLTSLGSKNIDPSKAKLEVRILSTNPVLEAFGNSKTARNNNSSRFGKYIKLYFDHEDGMVLGAEIKNYLLEKSRVVGNTEKERNYHAFFFMMRGMSDKLAKSLQINKPDGKRMTPLDFNYMKVFSDLTVESDVKEYKDLMEAFHNLGFTEEEQDAIHRITFACLFIGQLELDEKTYDPSARPNPTPVSIKNPEMIKKISDLLGIANSDDLVQEIVNKEAIEGCARTPEKPQNVKSTKDSLAKSLFDNMFNWLVAKMNIEILPEALKTGDPSDVTKFQEETRSVGLLDIFGFENFELNQFEQVCINYVNEKLHNLYLSSVFGTERKEMEREGVEVTLIQPKSLVKKILLLLDNNKKIYKTAPFGIFDLVSDASGGGMGGDDMTKRVKEFYDGMTKAHDKASVEVFLKIRNSKKFIIHHSAKDVTYDASFFIERNADSISGSLVSCISTKASSKISQIYSMKTGLEPKEDEDADPKAKKRTKAAPKTIWGKFSQAIYDLMSELAEPLTQDLDDPSIGHKPTLPKNHGLEAPCEKTDLHFIRCLKPNDKKVANFFSHSMTLQQITYMGVLESIKVKQVNFPYRKKHAEFYKLYELLSPAYGEGRYDLLSESEKASRNWKQLSEEIVKRVFSPLDKEHLDMIFPKLCAFGTTKILKMGEVKQVLDESKAKASSQYDKQSQYLKRAFNMAQANNESVVRKLALAKIENFMKVTIDKIHVDKANIFQKKLNLGLVAFKTEKRKDFEIDAAKVILDVYRKNVFRDKMNQAITSRKFMIQGIFDLASINRCRKMWICRRMIMKTFQGAFKKARLKKEQDSAYRIQRILRGHMERNGKEELVLEAIKSKVELKQHVSAKKVQKRLKGLIVRRRIAFLELKVSQIQSSMRMKWTRRVYKVIRRNVLILQKAYRRYMARRDQIKIRLYKFLAQELQVLENVKAMEAAQLHGNNVNRQQAQQMGLLKTLTPYSTKKINFFTRVIDIHILSDISEIYTQGWSSQWIKGIADSTLNETPIMHLSAGLTHTMIVNSKGKVFTWGWNDNGQCAKSSNINEVILNQPTIKHAQVNLESIIDKDLLFQVQNQGGITIKQAIAINDRCILLIKETNDVIVWGGNERGQCGLGIYTDVFKPTKIDTFSRPDVKVINIAAGGYLNLACTEKGDAYAWPFINNGIMQSIPSKMPFSDKTKILRVSCGHNFGFFISNQGLVYAFGEDNSEGQLGLGHTYPTEFPELIQCLRDVGERIDIVECGYRHAIAKSSLGKIYTWGASNKGQLGHDHFDSELSPRPLYIDRKNNKKVTQIAAGYSHCMVMMETNKELYWFGSCGNLQDQAFPIQFDLQRYLPDLFGPQGTIKKNGVQEYSQYVLGGNQQDFAIVKINSSWSKTMSLSTMVIADLRAVNQEIHHSKLMSTLQNLGNKWDPKDIMPPYIEIISGLFGANIMKKPAVLKVFKSVKATGQKSQAVGAMTHATGGFSTVGPKGIKGYPQSGNNASMMNTRNQYQPQR